MIINNKVLKQIEDSDIDENGVCFIPEGVDVIEYIESDRIKKLVIPEGVKILGTDYIYCSNLEQLELPSSLKKIGIINAKKLTLENIKFGNKTFIIDFKYSLGSIETTTRYINSIVQDLTNKIEESLNTNDYSSISFIMKTYNSFFLLINHDNQERLSYLIGKLLSQKVDEIEIGEKMIEECFESNKLLTPFFLQYFHFKECESLDLKWVPLIFLENHGNTACSSENEITLGYRNLIGKHNIIFRGQKIDDLLSMDDNVLFNLNSMFVLSHELQHSKQRANAERRKDIFDYIDYIDYNVSKAAPYNNDHDIHPDEIRADIGAYNFLIEYMDRLLPDSIGEKYKKIIEEIKLGRIKQAHQIDEDGNICVLDFRQRFLKKALDDNKLSDNLKKLLTLQKEYIQLLNIANSDGIDLFEESIGYYKSKKSEEDIQIK